MDPVSWEYTQASTAWKIYCKYDSEGRPSYPNYPRSRKLTPDDIGKVFVRTKPTQRCNFKDYSYVPINVNDIEKKKMTLVNIGEDGKLIFAKSEYSFTVEEKNDDGWTESSCNIS